MSIRERITTVMNNENLSAHKFASRLNVQPSAISHILSNRNKPSYDFIIKLLNAFPQYSADWLLLGKDNFAKDENINADSSLVIESDVSNVPQKSTDTPTTPYNSTLEFVFESDLPIINNNSANEIKDNIAEINRDESNSSTIDERRTEFNDQNQESLSPRSIEQVITLYSDGTFKNFTSQS